MHGLPMDYTTNLENARSSVELLASLQPERVITGHDRRCRAHRCAMHCISSPATSIISRCLRGGKYVEKPAAERKGGEYRQP